MSEYEEEVFTRESSQKVLTSNLLTGCVVRIKEKSVKSSQVFIGMVMEKTESDSCDIVVNASKTNKLWSIFSNSGSSLEKRGILIKNYDFYLVPDKEFSDLLAWLKGHEKTETIPKLKEILLKTIESVKSHKDMTRKVISKCLKTAYKEYPMSKDYVFMYFSNNCCIGENVSEIDLDSSVTSESSSEITLPQNVHDYIGISRAAILGKRKNKRR